MVLPGTPVEFREYGHHIVDNRAGIEVHPVGSRAEPGSIKAQLSSAPTKGAESSPDMDPKSHMRVYVSLAGAPAWPLVSLFHSLLTDVEAIVKSITGVVT